MRVDRTRLAQYLTTFNLVTGDTTQQCTNVIASFCEVQRLTEHFQTGNNGVQLFFRQTNDFNRFVNVQLSAFYTTGNNGTTARNGHSIFDRHQERLCIVTFRSRNVLVNSVHQFDDRLVSRIAQIVRSFQSSQSRTNDDRSVIAREVVLVQSFTNVHFNQFQQFRIVNLVSLVQEYNDCRYAYLTSQQDVLLGLSHRTVRSSNYQNCTVHLSCTSDHVLNIVSMSRAVNVSVVTLVSFILNVSSVDCDTTFSFFRSLIDHIVSFVLSLTLQSQCLGDSSSQCGLTMVNVTDGTNVYMGFSSFKFSLCHWNESSSKYISRLSHRNVINILYQI